MDFEGATFQKLCAQRFVEPLERLLQLFVENKFLMKKR